MKILFFLACFTLLSILFTIFFEFKFGKPPAKFLTNTIVVNKNGQRSQLKNIIIRSLCRIIPFEPMSFLLDEAWHDKIFKTYVIPDNK